MTYMGPTSSLSSSRFISCTVTYAGGAFYHNGYDNDFITLTDSLFTRNTADTFDDDYIDHGGGAMKDYRGCDYTSHYTFSFFSNNIAEKNIGHDIAITDHSLSEENIIHCLTTTVINAFSNAGDNETNWIP